MNDVPTVEIDYSSLHVILAYTEAGLDYWQNTDKDPYDLPVRGVNNPEHCRKIAKLFFLLSFNASTEQSLFKAFRSELNYTDYPCIPTLLRWADMQCQLSQCCAEQVAEAKSERGCRCA